MESFTNWEEVKKEYIRFALEYGFIDESVVYEDIVYARTKKELITKTWNCKHNAIAEQRLDCMIDDGLVDEKATEEHALKFLLEHEESQEKYLSNIHFTGEGFYDSWDKTAIMSEWESKWVDYYEACRVERIDKIIEALTLATKKE